MSGEPTLTEAERVMTDALGAVIAEMRQQWERERALIVAEARATVAELKLAAAEALLEKHDSQAAAKLKSITGGRS